MTKLGRFITILLVLCVATTAYAQTDDWYVSGGIVYTDDDPKRRIDDMVGGAEFAVGWNFSDHLSLEGALGYSKLDGFYLQNGVWVRDYETHLDLSANLLAFFNRDRAFAPFVSVGLGYLGVNYNLSGNENRPTASFGLGFKWQPMQSRWSLRGDAGARLAYEKDFNFTDYIVTLGAQYDFAGPNLFQRDGAGSSPGSSIAGLYSPWYVSGSIAYFDDDPDRRLDAGLTGLQINAGYDWTDHLTVEGHLGYHNIDGWYRRNNAFVRGSETQLDLSANLLAFYDRNRPFAPYLAMGIGYLGQNVKNGGSENRPSATFGMGFKWQLGQSRYSVRTEVRARLAYEQDFNYVDYVATLGVEYRFGARARDLGVPPVGDPSDKPQDTDGDGVLDWWDECPDTPPGVEVTSKGCEIKDMERDADGDRVPDYRDYCLDTPTGAPVDQQGCSLDSDMDGVPTGQDRCPGSLPGALVDEFGCDNDQDKDGVIDPEDRCPNTRPNVEVDLYGCEIRDVISLPGVNFQSGSDLLAPGAEELIRQIADTLKENEYLQIEVAGHTDSQGSEENNLGLSDRRAKTVFDYLFLYGVDPARLTFRGYGETQPIADNETSEGRAINRRVELRVIRK